MSWFSGSGSSGEAPRLRLIEKKLDAILEHLGIQFDDPLSDEVRQLLNAGQKIEAIKLYRKRSGAGLKEAKDAVESL